MRQNLQHFVDQTDNAPIGAPRTPQTDFQRIEGASLEAEMAGSGDPDSWELKRLRDSFESLAPDPYMPPEFGVRRRRFGRFRWNRDRELIPLAGTEFVQSTEINAVAGGVRRKFESLETDIRQSPALARLVEFLGNAIDDRCGAWLVNIHQVRVETNGAPSSAAPEGTHRDGHDYIAIIAVRRNNIEGGVNSIYGKERELLFETLLENPFDALLINDRINYHGVTPIKPAVEGTGYRDTLIIDFNRVQRDK